MERKRGELIHVRKINRNGAGGCGEVCPGNADRRRAASDEDTRSLKATAAGALAATAPTGEDTDMSLVFKAAFLVNVKSMLLVAPALLTTPIVEVKDVSVGPGALSLPVGLAHVVATGANIADAGSMRIGPRDPSLVPILNPPLLFTGQP